VGAHFALTDPPWSAWVGSKIPGIMEKVDISDDFRPLAAQRVDRIRVIVRQRELCEAYWCSRHTTNAMRKATGIATSARILSGQR
jgi:hypothetical protein